LTEITGLGSLSGKTWPFRSVKKSEEGSQVSSVFKIDDYPGKREQDIDDKVQG